MRDVLKRFGRIIMVYSMFVYFPAIAGLHREHVFAEKSSGTETASANMVPFYWLLGVVGGAIIVTLVYVGWKKYNAEHKRQDKRNNS